MTGGVVRRDGLREAVTEMRDRLAARATNKRQHWSRCAKPTGGDCSCSGPLREHNDRVAAEAAADVDLLARVLDAVPDVPSTYADEGDPCPKHRGSGVNRECPDCDQPYVPVVPPDPPAVTLTQMVNVAHLAIWDGRGTSAAASMTARAVLQAAWPLIERFAQLRAADVRARAERAVLDAIYEAVQWTDEHQCLGLDTRDHIREAISDYRTRDVRDRAVSEREGKRA